MNELLQAAKAVIEARVFTGPHREKLRAAVERAESRQHVRLSDEEIGEILRDSLDPGMTWAAKVHGFARAIEAKIWEKNQ